jgi:hypothetical protein
MTLASIDNQSVGTDYHPLGLRVILLKRTYVFPWSQFLYAEGGNDEVRLTFATHDILIKGRNLNLLVAGIASHGIAKLQEPARADRFLNETGSFIREISVQKIDQDQA